MEFLLGMLIVGLAFFVLGNILANKERERRRVRTTSELDRCSKAVERAPALLQLPDQNDVRFTETRHVVEANDAERHGIWFRWHELGQIEFQQVALGWRQAVAQVAGEQMVVQVFWYRIAGQRVAFVDLTAGAVWNRNLARQWLEEAFPYTKTRSDALNFHHIILDLDETSDETLLTRPYADILRATNTVPVAPIRPRSPKRGEP